MSSEQIKFITNLFTKICEDFKRKIHWDKIKNKEYFVRQKININYTLVGELFNLVAYIDSSQFVARLYTDFNNNIGVSLEALKRVNNTILSKIVIMKDNKILHEEIFIY